jgi:UDP-glucose 4-epimerase
MTILVTGSSGHLGEALVRSMRAKSLDVVGLDIAESEYTDIVGSVTDATLVRSAMGNVEAVLHTATLHKPHLVTHSRQAFVDTNISGTLVLLEEARRSNVTSFVFTSSTSAFGHSLKPNEDGPAVWVTEDLQSVPKNAYGITKIAAEQLCELFSRKHKVNCVVLRTSRFFPEEDDNAAVRDAYDDTNAKVNEYLFRRIDLQDVVDAHLLAIEYSASVRFDRLILSATTPFRLDDIFELRNDAARVVQRYYPEFRSVYERLGWTMFPSIDRVYVNTRARRALNWEPRYDFRRILDSLLAGSDPRSELAREVGRKGYHAEVFDYGPYPVE